MITFDLGNAEGHHCVVDRKENGEWLAICECKAEWSYQREGTIEHMKSIYESHLSYFKRKPIEIL